MVACLALFAGITMLCGLTIRANISWVGYKGSKAMTYAMEALCNIDKHFHGRLKALKNTRAVLAKGTLNDFHTLKTRKKWSC